MGEATESGTAITARDVAIREEAAAAFDAVGVSRRLLRTIRSGALATLDPSGHPFASLTNIASDVDGAPLILVSQLAFHTRNLARDPRVSLLLATSGKGDPLAHPRLTVSGRAVAVADDERARRRFLAHHPKAATYAGFPDFAFWRIEPDALSLNGGPARAAEPAVDAVLLDLAAAAAVMDGEEGALAHMNADHGEAIGLYATRLAGLEEGRWRLAGIDPEGMDLALGDRLERFVFPEKLAEPGDVGRMLKRLAAEARGRSSS